MTLRGSLETILRGINREANVLGSAVVSREGLIMAADLPAGFNAELVGAMAASVDAAAESVSLELQNASPEHIIIKSGKGIVISVPTKRVILIVLANSKVNLGVLLSVVKRAVVSLKSVI